MASPTSSLDSTLLPPPLLDPPSAVPLALPTPPPSSSSRRRLPPLCWSQDETVALIDAYRDKWYSLGRSNLKATHWQDVADAVTNRWRKASPPKTAVQCRHKMEKLRKRYRTEIQRALSLPVSRFNSSWVHFKRMESMDKGPDPPKPENESDNHDNNDNDDEDHDLFEKFKNTRSLNKLYRNGIGGSGGGGSGGGGSRIRIPTGLTVAEPGSKFYGKVGDQKLKLKTNLSENPNSNPSSNCYGTRVLKGKRDPVGEMVCAIRVLGDGIVRMEQMKMEMAREIESMRMEMEMKRTEMILDSQQRIVEAFAEVVSEKKMKKAKKMPSPQEH